MPNHKIEGEEILRLRSLRETEIIKKDISVVHSDIRLLAEELDMPICAVTVIGSHFQHMKVSVGTDLVLVHRDHAFCSHTILQDDIMVVEDATLDVRFRDNPYVLDGPKIRFYAGAPLRTLDGRKLGAVCLIDVKPRSVTSAARKRLLAVTDTIATKIFANELELSLSHLSVQELLNIIRNDAKILIKKNLF